MRVKVFPQLGHVGGDWVAVPVLAGVVIGAGNGGVLVKVGSNGVGFKKGFVGGTGGQCWRPTLLGYPKLAATGTCVAYTVPVSVGNPYGLRP